jgi:DnaJ-class molecular chaperone
MAINDNSLDLSKYRGTVKPCPVCSSRSDAAKLEALMSAKACKVCFGHGFVAMCINCKGTGMFSGSTVWDGGRSEHKSTCTPCGGAGMFPVKRPADWVDEQPVPVQVEGEGTVQVPASTVPAGPRNLPPPITMGSGTILHGGVAVK